jgi:tetratricopeptide (TPR) repeat protein
MKTPGAARAQRFGFAALAPLALSLGITGWVFWESQRMIRSDLGSMAARQDVARWAGGIGSPPSPAAWEAAREAIERAISITPDNAAFHDALGNVHMVAGSQPWFAPEEQRKHFLQAIDSYQESLRLRPTEPQTWASLASAYFGAGESGAPLHQAWARALALGPNEGHVQPMLMDLALATWRTATPQMRSWVETTFENASDSGRKAINEMAALRGLQLSSSTTPAPPEPSAQPKP